MKDEQRLLGQLEEFKEWAKIRFNELEIGHKDILREVAKINKERFIFTGKLSIFNAIVLILIEIVMHKI